MITHIVLFTLRDRTPESIERTAKILRDMEGKIDELLFIEVGTDILHLERSRDIALTTRFASMEALQAYNVHPVHQKVIEHMKTACESSVSVDYES